MRNVIKGHTAVCVIVQPSTLRGSGGGHICGGVMTARKTHQPFMTSLEQEDEDEASVQC